MRKDNSALREAVKLLIKNNFWISKHGFDIVKNDNEFVISESIGGEVDSVDSTGKELDKLVDLFLEHCS